jgi:hypothetical protein
MTSEIAVGAIVAVMDPLYGVECGDQNRCLVPHDIYTTTVSLDHSGDGELEPNGSNRTSLLTP